MQRALRTQADVVAFFPTRYKCLCPMSSESLPCPVALCSLPPRRHTESRGAEDVFPKSKVAWAADSCVRIYPDLVTH